MDNEMKPNDMDCVSEISFEVRDRLRQISSTKSHKVGNCSS